NVVRSLRDRTPPDFHSQFRPKSAAAPPASRRVYRGGFSGEVNSALNLPTCEHTCRKGLLHACRHQIAKLTDSETAGINHRGSLGRATYFNRRDRREAPR